MAAVAAVRQYIHTISHMAMVMVITVCSSRIMAVTQMATTAINRIMEDNICHRGQRAMEEQVSHK